MTRVNALLESIADGKNIRVQLSDGDVFILYDFEMVDESIYHRTDVVIATIRNVLASKYRFQEGTKLEIFINDIIRLDDPLSGDCIFVRE